MANLLNSFSIWFLLTASALAGSEDVEWRWCSEWPLASNFETACLCLEDSDGQFTMNCDYLWIDDGVAKVPAQMQLRGYTHRHAGLQNVDIIRRLVASHNDSSLKWIDLSDNQISKLNDLMFVESLQEIYLRNNWLGDQLNPVFTTESFNKLNQLQKLDMGGNRIRAIDDGLFKRLQSITHLKLDNNQLKEMPVLCLKKLPNLHTLELQNNQIGALSKVNFSSSSMSLSTLNLSSNTIGQLSSSSFYGLSNLVTLDLSRNTLTSLDVDDAFDGLMALVTLDLSDNYITRFPKRALTRVTSTLRDLRMSSNDIREISAEDFANLNGLLHLDLSRNRIGNLPPNVFQSLTSLRSLDLRVNLIRKLDQTHLTGLIHLRHLNLRDNTFLGWPASTLGELQSLDHLSIGYNRIAAISPQLFDTVSQVQELSLEFNLLREIPDGTFRNFSQLQMLNLKGNRLLNVTMETFVGVETTLTAIDLSLNELETFPAIGKHAHLVEIILANNKIAQIPTAGLANFRSLQKLDMSRNRLSDISLKTFENLTRLKHLDFSKNNIKTLKRGLFHHLLMLEYLDISNNALDDIGEETFVDLPNLRHLKLANSGINNMHPKTLGENITSLSTIDLSGNYLTAVNTQTLLPALISIDLSRNNIQTLNADSLKKWPNLRHIRLSFNRLAHLESVSTNWPKLESLILNNNQLQRIESGQFNHAKRLRLIDIGNNLLEDIEEGAFRGSVQIRRLKLSSNRLANLNEGSFNEMALLDIDMGHNNISNLPPNLFSRVNVHSLVAIRMSYNRLNVLPMTSLDNHVSSLKTIDVSDNKIQHVTPNSDILANVKCLNLANNPLTTKSLHSIFTEPKMVQDLDVTNCSVETLPSLETPFLRRLNISGNRISTLNRTVFRRATLLQHLDISNNRLSDIKLGLEPIWSEIPDLKSLNISRNFFKVIGESDFEPLKHLETFDMSQLSELGRLGHESLMHLSNLKHLFIYGYPRLGFYDLKGLLESMSALESLKVEVKGNILRDQLQPAFNSRLASLSISGSAIDTLTSVSFAGLTAPNIRITISNTNVSQIPNAVFLPLPMSSQLDFDVGNNRIATMSAQLLATVEEKKNRIRLTGLNFNPITCDCHLKAFHKWVIEQILRGNEMLGQLRCQQPAEMLDKAVWALRDVDLTCDKPAVTVTYEASTTTMTTTTTTTTQTPVTTSIYDKTVDEEPDIIYEAPATKPIDNNLPTDQSLGNIQNSLTNMDSMIIGIIVGVVAFVCILIIIICILKLRHTHHDHRPHPHYQGSAYLNGGLGSGGPGSVLQGGGGGGGGSSCTCSNSKDMMLNGSQIGHHYELSSKMQMAAAAMNGTLDSRRHQRNGNYYVSYPESDNGCR